MYGDASITVIAPEEQVEPGRGMRDADRQADFQTVSTHPMNTGCWLTNRFIVWTYTFGGELFCECLRMVSTSRESFSASGGKNEAFLVLRSPDDDSRKTVCSTHAASGAPDSPAC